MEQARIQKIIDSLEGLSLTFSGEGKDLEDLRKNIKFKLVDDTSSSPNLPEAITEASIDAPKLSSATVTLDISPSRIFTRDVISSLLNQKKNKRVKEGTLETYQKRLKLFEQRFEFLPEYVEPIMGYLARFDGESGRYRLNHQDLLNMLYEHAVHRFGLVNNPLKDLERPLITHKPVKTLNMKQVHLLHETPQTLPERVALDLLLGHGWRQIEVRRILAEDAAAIEDNLILCRGKERQEMTPLLPETVENLKQMAMGLKPQEHLFVAQLARGGRKHPLGEDGMAQLVERLMTRAGIQGFTGHDLRRTFATLVTSASNDELLAMRLLRDSVPGLSNRYIKYPMEQLVTALKKYSPVCQIAENKKATDAEIKGEIEKELPKLSPVCLSGESPKIANSETGKELVETGEG